MISTKVEPEVGRTYGHLKALTLSQRDYDMRGKPIRTVKCSCVCGSTPRIRVYDLVNGKSTNCGCRQLTQKGESSTPLYKKWRTVINRCSEKSKDKRLYYDRGIKVCTEWLDFFAFKEWALSNGFKQGLYIDRIDNNLGYNPDNCRFSTAKESANNLRTNKTVLYHGIPATLFELFNWLEIPEAWEGAIRGRLKRNWKVEDALETPVIIKKKITIQQEKSYAIVSNDKYQIRSTHVPSLSVGDVFNFLTVEKDLGKTLLKGNRKLRSYECRCECGNLATVSIYDLKAEKVRSCGCQSTQKHGETGSALYKRWRAMQDRCQPNAIDSHIYFHRGIKVWDKWVKSYELFKRWAETYGFREDLHIDRIDNNKGYFPENCRFVTPVENMNNRDVTRMVSYRGEHLAFQTLCRRLQVAEVSIPAVWERINRGWTVEDAFDTPIRQGNYRKK